MSINVTKQRYRKARKQAQNGKCFYCFLRMGQDCTLEHLLAQSLGGDDSYSNIRAAHAKCNSLVGSFPVYLKIRLHKLGQEEGSDAFFREVTRLGNSEKKRKRKNKKESGKARLENALDMYQSRDSYAEAYGLLPQHLQRLFYPPVEAH